MFKINRLLALIILSVGLYTSCEKKFVELEFFEVETGGFETTDDGMVTLSGKIINIADRLPNLEYGFIYSCVTSNLSLPSADQITIHSLNGQRAFQEGGENEFELSDENLLIDSIYYYRAYAKDKERIQYGRLDSFRFNLEISISNRIEINNDSVLIKGLITGLKTTNEIIIDHGHIIGLSEESLIYNPDDNFTNSMGVITSNGEFPSLYTGLDFYTEYYAVAFIIIENNPPIFSKEVKNFCLEEGWKKVRTTLNGASFQLPLLQGAFSIENQTQQEAYIGLGCDDLCEAEGSSDYNRIYKFQENTEEILEGNLIFRRDSPPYRANSVSFVSGNMIYFGLGDLDGDSTFFADFWELNPQNGNLIQMAPYPGGPRSRATAFEIDGIGYVGTGINEALRDQKDFYRFSPPSISGISQGVWDTIAPLDMVYLKGRVRNKGRSEAISFVLDNTGYVGLGRSSNSDLKDFWKYEEATNSWVQLEGIPEDFEPRYGATNITIRGKVYFGLGRNPDIAFSDWWELYIDGRQTVMTQKKAFPAAARSDAIGFVLNNKGYIGTGWFNENQSTIPVYNDIWVYYPPQEEKCTQ